LAISHQVIAVAGTQGIEKKWDRVPYSGGKKVEATHLRIE
jgi:hypothetical protein